MEKELEEGYSDMEFQVITIIRMMYSGRDADKELKNPILWENMR